METPITAHMQRIEHLHENLLIANRKVLADFRTILRRAPLSLPSNPFAKS